MADSGEPDPLPPAEAGEGDPTHSAINRWVRKTGRMKRPVTEPDPAERDPAEGERLDPSRVSKAEPIAPELQIPATRPSELREASRALEPPAAEVDKPLGPPLVPKVEPISSELQVPAASNRPKPSRRTARVAKRRAPAPLAGPAAPPDKALATAAASPPKRVYTAPLRKGKKPRKAVPGQSLRVPAKRGRPVFAGLRSRLEHGFSSSPAFMVATLVHALLLLVLSLFTVARYVKQAPKEVEVALRAQTRVEDDAEQEPRETVSSLLKTPPLPAELALEEPHNEALGAQAGPAPQDASVLFGLEGSSGRAKGQGGKVTRGAHGPSAASDGARDAGLDWLARHRTADSAWGVIKRVHRPGDSRRASPDVGRTGLAVLAFLAAGHSPNADGPYQQLLVDARSWLIRRCKPTGVFLSPGQLHHLYYQQAIGTLALAELKNVDPANDDTRMALQRSVDFLESRRGRWGWRYPDSPDAWSGDTSVNTWVTLALKAARAADATVQDKSFRVVKRFLDRVTGSDGTTGYAIRGQNATDAMNASGLFLRIMLGESPSSKRNANAVRLVQYAGGPREVEGSIFNLYGTYYASLALYQVGGKAWEDFNPVVRDGLVKLQAHRKGCELGSWVGGGYLGHDRVLGTAFATLTLETYYRYLPTHDGVVEEKPESPERVSLGEATLIAATDALREAKKSKAKGDLLAVEAKLAAAAEAIREDTALDAAQRDALLTRCRERLVAVAVLARDSALSLERAQSYLEGLPAGMPPSGAVLAVLVEEGYMQLVRASAALLSQKQPREPDLREQLDAIQAFQDAPLRPELPPGTRRRVPSMHEALSAQRAELVFRMPPLTAHEYAERWVQGSDPKAERAPGPIELRWADALVKQAERGYRAAAQAGDERAFGRAEAARATLGTRKLLARLSAQGRARRRPRYTSIEALRVHGLLRLGRLAEAASAAYRLGTRHPSVQSDAKLLERKALAELRQAGPLTPEQLARYRVLLAAWASSTPQDPGERLALAGELRAVGSLDEASVLYRTLRDHADRVLRDEALVALAGMARKAGRYAEARGWLEACRPRVGVRLELARLARAEGRKREALSAYVGLLQALEDLDQDRWWEVAEELAFAYRDLGYREQAFRFANELRLKDAEFGGDAARKRRLIKLLSEVM